MIRVTLVVLLFCILAACGSSVEDDWLKGEMGVVVRVTDGDTFALNTGQVVRLVSVEAPSIGYRGGEDMPYAQDSKAFLETLVLGRRVELFYPGLTRDRYDRALAHAFVQTESGERIWINEAVVEAGAAWVRLYPDTKRGSEAFWEVEDRARHQKLGLWAENAPTFRDRSELPDSRFVIINTQSVLSELVDGRCELVFATSTLTGSIKSPLNLACPALETGPVEVRGWHRRGHIYVDAAENIRAVKRQE